jgi:hypothetical protein
MSIELMNAERAVILLFKERNSKIRTENATELSVRVRGRKRKMRQIGAVTEDVREQLATAVDKLVAIVAAEKNINARAARSIVDSWCLKYENT